MKTDLVFITNNITDHDILHKAWLSVCSGCCQKTPQTWGLKQQTLISHSSGGWSPRSRCLLTWSLVRPFSRLGDGCPLSVATCSERRETEGERERQRKRERQNELPGVCSYKGTNPNMGTTPRTSSHPHHLSKPLTSPNTITLEVRVSTYGFVGGHILSVTRYFYVTLVQRFHFPDELCTPGIQHVCH